MLRLACSRLPFSSSTSSCCGSGGGVGALQSLGARLLSSSAAPAPAVHAESAAEKEVASKLQAGLEGAHLIKVADTSGGCGAMYSIEVVAPQFEGKSIVKQHQLVTALLKEHIAQWHGFQLVTRAP